MQSKSDQIVKISSETLVIGLAIFVLLVVLDRMSNTTYFRDRFWTLFAASVLLIAPSISAFYHLTRWASRLQRGARARVSR